MADMYLPERGRVLQGQWYVFLAPFTGASESVHDSAAHSVILVFGSFA